MPDINPSLPIVGQPDSTEEPKVVTALSQLIAAVNNVDTDQIADGAIQPQDLATSLADALGVTAAGIVRRGKAIIPTSENRTNAAFGTMPTADKVTLSLQTDGLIFAVYQATVASNDTAAEAAMFLNSSQLRAIAGGTANNAVPMSVGAYTAAIPRPLVSHPGGLIIPNTAAFVEPTTGLLVGAAAVAGNPSAMDTKYNGTSYSFLNETAMVGGPMMIWANAGTYDLTVQYKSPTLPITVKSRHLWAWTIGF